MTEDDRQASLELLADLTELVAEIKTTIRTLRAHLVAADLLSSRRSGEPA